MTRGIRHEAENVARGRPAEVHERLLKMWQLAQSFWLAYALLFAAVAAAAERQDLPVLPVATSIAAGSPPGPGAFFAAALVAGRAQEDLLDRLRTAHRSAVQSIYSFSCHFAESDDTHEGHWELGGEYWRSPDAIRVHWRIKNPNGVADTDDVLIRGDRVLNLNTQVSPYLHLPGGRHTSGVIRPRTLRWCYVWEKALFEFGISPDPPPKTLDEFLLKPNELRCVKPVAAWGHEVIYLDVVIPNKRRLELWFDPEFNYLARKVVVHTPSAAKVSSGEFEVVRFREVASGIYFPERIDMRWFSTDGQLEASGVRTFTDLRVNQRLPADILEFRFPPGVEVLDTIQSKLFKVDADGKLQELHDRRVGPGPPLGGGKLDPPWKISDNTTRVIREQADSGGTLLLELGLLALWLVINGWFLFRRKKAAAASGS